MEEWTRCRGRSSGTALLRSRSRLGGGTLPLDLVGLREDPRSAMPLSQWAGWFFVRGSTFAIIESMRAFPAVLCRGGTLITAIAIVVGFSFYTSAEQQTGTANFACLGGSPKWKHTEERDGVRGLIGKLCRETREGVEVEGECGGFLDCDPKRYKDFNERWVAIPEDKSFETLHDELRYAQARREQADIDYPPAPPPRPLSWSDIFSALFQRPQAESENSRKEAGNLEENTESPTRGTYRLASAPPDASVAETSVSPKVRINEGFAALPDRFGETFGTLSQDPEVARDFRRQAVQSDTYRGLFGSAIPYQGAAYPPATEPQHVSSEGLGASTFSEPDSGSSSDKPNGFPFGPLMERIRNLVRFVGGIFGQ